MGNNFHFNTGTKVFLLFVAVAIMVGFYFFASSFAPKASRKAKKTVKAFNERNKPKTNSQAFDGALNGLATKLSKYVTLSPIERSELLKALQITGSSKTPEEHRAMCWISGGLFISIGLLMTIAGYLIDTFIFKAVGFAGDIFGIIYYIYLRKNIQTEKNEAIGGVDKELPRFVAFINTALQKQNTSILSIVERYVPRNDRFAAEIGQTIADAKTSNFNGAVARWDQRMNSDKLKRVVRGLINANNGDDVRVYFAMLEKDFNAYELTLLKQNAKSIPQKMRLPKMLMYSSVALALFFPIIMQVVESFQLFFTT